MAFHQPAANQLRGNDLRWTAQEGVGQGGESLGDGLGGYGSGFFICLHRAAAKPTALSPVAMQVVLAKLPAVERVCDAAVHSPEPLSHGCCTAGTGIMAQVSAKPVQVAQGTASDLGVMSIQLKDIVKPQVGIQGQTQAAGTPNQAGLGGFLPLVVGSNSVSFADVLANANFADINNSSIIINTTVAGTTISTSSRLG